VSLWPRDDQSSDSTLEPAQQLKTALSLTLTQVNHVKLIEGNDESTDTKTEQRADRDWLSFVFTRPFTRQAPKIS
jgi:hypothetical protein